MSRVLKRLHGSGTDGAWVDGVDQFKLTPHIDPLRNDLDLLMLGVAERNKYLGGSHSEAIALESTGDKDLVNWFPWILDNSNTQISAFTDAHGGVLVAQIRFLLRVNNAAINLTPKIVYGTSISTMTTVATISGQAACAATSSAYTGSQQVQTVAFTLPTGVKWFKPMVTAAGTAAVGRQGWVVAIGDLYVAT